MSWVSDAANIFSALGTVGAFGVALFLIRNEQQREAVRSEDERRSQATKVSAWIETRGGPTGGRELLFHVHNASDMPIYEVSLPVMFSSDDSDEEAEFIGLVPPGQTVMRTAPREWLKSYLTPEPVPLEFLDSSGQRWVRDQQGTLASG